MPSPHDRPVLLTTTASDHEAASLEALLAAEGILAVRAGSYTSSFQAEAPGRVEVLVPSKQLDAAKRLLAEIKTSGAQVDWSQVDLGEPDE
ncbi:MAG: DUF2007 domain-containing protein [Planctomycetota bacterium]